MAEVEVISLKTRRPLVAEHPRDHYRELPKGVGGAAWIMLFAGITWLARMVLERMV
jgi:hypothetical protein